MKLTVVPAIAPELPDYYSPDELQPGDILSLRKPEEHSASPLNYLWLIVRDADNDIAYQGFGKANFRATKVSDTFSRRVWVRTRIKELVLEEVQQ